MAVDTTASPAPLYFELSWAILSTIGIANVIYGLTIIGITSLSPATLVPIVVSAAGAVANGLCYYTYYNPGTKGSGPIAAAAAIADLMWLVQEAGISLYSYIILTHVLQGREKMLFMALFWALIAAISVVTLFILVERVRTVERGGGDGADGAQRLVNHLHLGYFMGIALVESVSAVFLLRLFTQAKKSCAEAHIQSSLFRHCLRSAEFRLASLTLVGISRTATTTTTFFFQPTLQSAASTASQIDRFVYTLECMFPIMIYIDILCSQLASSKRPSEFSSFVSKNSRSGVCGSVVPMRCARGLACPTEDDEEELQLQHPRSAWRAPAEFLTTAAVVSDASPSVGGEEACAENDARHHHHRHYPHHHDNHNRHPQQRHQRQPQYGDTEAQRDIEAAAGLVSHSSHVSVSVQRPTRAQNGEGITITKTVELGAYQSSPTPPNRSGEGRSGG